MSRQVSIHEATSQLDALITSVLEGESVTIARAGRPVVDLVPDREVTVVYGVGQGYQHDPEVFDGTDAEVVGLFYGHP